MKTIFKFCLLLLLGELLSGPAFSAPPNDANGAAPRPVYIMANNPNNLADIADALSRGCNALEPDIAVASDGQLRCYDTSSPYRNANSSDPLFTDWLQTTYNLVKPGGAQAGKVAFIAFDCKSAGIPFTSGEAVTILNLIRNTLNTNGVMIPFVLNVGKVADVNNSFYSAVFPLLGPLEGVQCDDTGDAAGEFPLFRSLGYTANVAWGTGGQDYESGGLGWSPLDRSAFYRAQYGYPKTIPYLFDYVYQSDISELFNSGADGVICNDGTAVIAWNAAILFSGGNPPFSISYQAINNAVAVVQSRNDIRLATAADNPFQPKGESYGLYITTATTGGAGTDANLTFTLNGANGSSSVTVDTSRDTRMENGHIDYVTIPSKDLGALISITIANDNGGSGPQWNCSSIQVSSARWLGASSMSAYYQTFPEVINGGETLTSFFGGKIGNGDSVLYVNSVIPGNTSANPNGDIGSPWQDFYTAYNFLQPNGVINLGGGQSYITSSGVPGVNGRLDKPCRIAKEPTYPAGNAKLVAR